MVNEAIFLAAENDFAVKDSAEDGSGVEDELDDEDRPQSEQKSKAMPKPRLADSKEKKKKRIGTTLVLVFQFNNFYLFRSAQYVLFLTAAPSQL
jgi:hypothetical protein